MGQSEHLASSGQSSSRSKNKIVDAHQHFIHIPPSFPETAITAWMEPMAAGFYTAHGGGARSQSVPVSTEQICSRFLESIPDPDGTKLVARMDRAGVDVSVMLVVDNVVAGTSDDEAMIQNRLCAELAAKSNGRLIALAGVDPRRPKAPDMLRRCIEEYGMRGLKFHPLRGYYPNSPEAYAVLKVAEELRIPMVTHTGPLAPGAAVGLPEGQKPRSKFADPNLLDDVAWDFPDLKIVAAHMGGHVNWRDWAALAALRSNLYGDLAIWAVTAVADYDRFCHELRECLDLAGPDSILFGSDDPLISALVPNEQFIQILKDLPEKAPAGLRFTEEEVAAILGGNAQKVFGI